MTGKNLICFGVRHLRHLACLKSCSSVGGIPIGGGGQCVLNRARRCDIYLFQKNGEKAQAVQTKRCVGDP